MFLRLRIGQIQCIEVALLNLRKMADAGPSLRAAVGEWEQCYNTAKFDEFVNVYTPDAVLLPADGPRIENTSEFGAVFKKVHDDGHVTVKFDVHEYNSAGDWAWMCNRVNFYNTDGNVSMTLKTLEVYKKVGERWLLHRDSFSPAS